MGTVSRIGSWNCSGMALGINRETAARLLVKLACRLFGESFWELGRKGQIRAHLVKHLKNGFFIEEKERGEGGRGRGVSLMYFTFSSGLDTGFYFLSQ